MNGYGKGIEMKSIVPVVIAVTMLSLSLVTIAKTITHHDCGAYGIYYHGQCYDDQKALDKAHGGKK